MSNRQGSIESDKLDNEALSKIYEEAIEHSYQAYQKLLKAGVAREMARCLLPVAQYTQFYWTINLRSLLNFISLRADSHAQYEIRVYANAIKEIVKQKMPWSFAAFEALEKNK